MLKYAALAATLIGGVRADTLTQLQNSNFNIGSVGYKMSGPTGANYKKYYKVQAHVKVGDTDMYKFRLEYCTNQADAGSPCVTVEPPDEVNYDPDSFSLSAGASFTGDADIAVYWGCTGNDPPGCTPPSPPASDGSGGTSYQPGQICSVAGEAADIKYDGCVNTFQIIISNGGVGDPGQDCMVAYHCECVYINSAWADFGFGSECDVIATLMNSGAKPLRPTSAPPTELRPRKI